MRILTIAATELEINQLKATLPADLINNVDFEITGIGSMITAFNLTKILLNRSYDYVIQTGIAGTLDPKIPIGMICQVISETLTDLGSENKDGNHLSVFDLKLIEKDQAPFKGDTLLNPTKIELPELLKVNGSTLNKSLGSNRSINHFKEKFPNLQLESLEGAALFYVCSNLKVKFIELRAISNIVEERNRASWQIELALNNLKEMYIKVLKLLIP